ncbi:proteasome assembly chaperone family protein [Timonella sp. A28]|uniref:proteasome assembly chaperone family protein n=1 Tax=Timonella sp. A28 TaxID=3442640 RepID=UPI003EBD624A
MINPRDLFDIQVDRADSFRERAQASQVGPVLICGLKGFVDAGHAGAIAVERMLEVSEPHTLAVFDHDRLVDYQAKRPILSFEDSRWTHYEPPRLTLDLLTDARGTEYLLLHGHEPNRYWEALSEGLIELIHDFNVSLFVTASGLPMGVPHTRPGGAIVHANREDLVGASQNFVGNMSVPASFAHYAQYEIGRHNVDAAGIAVHVPHYLAQSQYTPVGIVALSKIEEITGLHFDVDEMAEAAREAIAEVDRQVEKSHDVAEMVAGLEAQYDAFMASHPEESLLAHTNHIPTADELGAEFEQFLSQFNRRRGTE